MIDPARTGPIELAERAYEWLVINSIRILGVGLAGTVVVGIGVERGWFTIPSIPTSIWVMLSAAVAGAVLGAYPVYRAILSLWDDDVVRLVDLDPVTGDLTVWRLSEERFSDLRVVDHQGTEHEPKTYLSDVRLGSGELAYEVDGYDVEDNVAIGSWTAGVSDRHIRRHEKAVKYIKRELSVEADKTLDQLINSSDVLRQQGKTIGMYLIKQIEGIQTPQSAETRLYTDMFDTLDDADITDSLLDSTGVEDPEEAIREFARERDDAERDDLAVDDVSPRDGAAVEPAQSDESLASSVATDGGSDGGDRS